jgi:hypothetical protein
MEGKVSQKNREQRIRERAYFLSQQAGFPVGRDQVFWDQASQLEPRWLWPGRLRSLLVNLKDALSTIQSAATILALGVGALWTWWLFDIVSQREPNLYITQNAEAKKLDQDLLLLHVTFLLENTGKVTTYLTCADFIIYRVIPADSEDLMRFHKEVGNRKKSETSFPSWPPIKRRIDERLAKHEVFVEVGSKVEWTVDFVLPITVASASNERLRTVQIYSNFQMGLPGNRKCRRKPDEGIEGPGWTTETLYEIPS